MISPAKKYFLIALSAILLVSCAQVYNPDGNCGGFLGGGSSGYGYWLYDTSDYVPPGMMRLPGNWYDRSGVENTRLALHADGTFSLLVISDNGSEETLGLFRCNKDIIEFNIDNYHYLFSYSLKADKLILESDSNIVDFIHIDTDLE